LDLAEAHRTQWRKSIHHFHALGAIKVGMFTAMFTPIQLIARTPIFHFSPLDLCSAPPPKLNSFFMSPTNYDPSQFASKNEFFSICVIYSTRAMMDLAVVPAMKI